jgi:hypothetical protein
MGTHRHLDELVVKLERDIRALRLYLCGQIEILGAYWYEMGEKDNPEMVSATVTQRTIDQAGEAVSQRDIKPLNDFLAKRRQPLNHEYIQLAWDHWDQSMGTKPEHLEFLSLVMSLEALFNVSQTDLRYRVARSMAVLLGHDSEHSEDIYGQTKDAYDIRSRLVHTGKSDKLKEFWMWSFRHDVNRAIRRLIELDLPKDTVSEILTRLPFGVGDKITRGSISVLPMDNK